MDPEICENARPQEIKNLVSPELLLMPTRTLQTLILCARWRGVGPARAARCLGIFYSDAGNSSFKQVTRFGGRILLQ